MNKTKWIVAISSLCLSITMLVIGVLALTSVPLVVGGNVNFTADGVIADISKGTLSGGSNSGSSMNAVSINVNNNWSTVESNLNTWKSLNLSFADGSEKITLSFTVTNKHTSDYLEINTSIDSGTSNNIVISTSSANTVLYPNTTANNSAQTDRYTFNIDFYLVNPEQNANVSGFTVNISLQQYTIPDVSTLSGGLTFTTGSGVATVTGYNDQATYVKIPFMYKNGSNTYKVTQIGDRAFENSPLESISIPNSITTIGSYAFDGCSSLTSTTIPNSVITVSRNAFYGCSSMEYAMIPNSVTSIGQSAFAYSGIKFVVLPNTISSLGGSSYSSCTNLIDVKVYCQTVSQSAFSGCDNLKNVTLDGLVKNINDSAFISCAYTQIYIPASVTLIGDGAFSSDSLELAFFENPDGWGNSDEEFSVSVSDAVNPIYMANLLKNGMRISC